MRIYLDQVTKKKVFWPARQHQSISSALCIQWTARTHDGFIPPVFFFCSFKRQLYAKQIIQFMSVVFVFVIVSLGVNNYIYRAVQCVVLVVNQSETNSFRCHHHVNSSFCHWLTDCLFSFRFFSGDSFSFPSHANRNKLNKIVWHCSSVMVRVNRISIWDFYISVLNFHSLHLWQTPPLPPTFPCFVQCLVYPLVVAVVVDWRWKKTKKLRVVGIMIFR